MIKAVGAFLLVTALAGSAAAQLRYPVAQVPAQLLSHASAVVRDNETTVEVKSLDNVIYHHKLAVTVLNNNGDGQARLSLNYSKTERIAFIKGAVYNELGVQTGKITERDFKDYGAVDDYSLFLDDRYKYFKPAVTQYPYTVEYDYEVDVKQTMMFNDWDPNPHQTEGTSVQHSSYKFICKPDFNIRYKELNFAGKPVLSEDNISRTYFWEINNLPAVRDEPLSPPDDQLYTCVKLAPDKFQYGSVTGQFTNWHELGKWYADKMLAGRQGLDGNTVNAIKELTANITEPKLKAKAIYEYMQKKTRYVSVQIGIGGWQPFTADEVDKTSYGDCKALVNYTQALMSAAGVESYYVQVMSGDKKISPLTDFASINQFDHIILCLPFKNDTTWVDCTSKDLPFGYLGDFTDDRLALASTPKGGILLHTPRYAPQANKQVRKAQFALAENGTLTGSMETRFEGVQYDNRQEVINESFAEQVKTLKRIYPVENLEISGLKLTQTKTRMPLTVECLTLEAQDYLAHNGERFFFTPNIANRSIRTLKNLSNRQNSVYINRGYLDEDEVTYTLPAGYAVTSKMLKISLDKPFGHYAAALVADGNKLTYTRTLQINDGYYSKDTYADLVDFFETIHDADNYNVALVKGR